MATGSIDPGTDGAVLFRHGSRYSWHRMPIHRARVGKSQRGLLDVHGLRSLIWAERPDLMLIELQHPIRGQGLASTASIMRSFGLIEGICAGLGIPYQLVRAQDWRKAAKLQADKVHSLRHLQRLCPDLAAQIAKAPKAVQIAIADCWCMLQLSAPDATSKDDAWLC